MVLNEWPIIDGNILVHWFDTAGYHNNSITWGKHSEGHQVPFQVPFEFLPLKAKVKGICSKEY